MNNTIKWIRIGLGTIAGAGASLLVGSAIKKNTDMDEAGPLKRAAMMLGGSVIGMIVADKADKYVSDAFDELWDGVSVIRKALSDTKETETEAEENG